MCLFHILRIDKAVIDTPFFLSLFFLFITPTNATHLLHQAKDIFILYVPVNQVIFSSDHVT